MAKSKEAENWYARLNKIFRGPAIKRRIRDYRSPPTSTALELFSKTQSFVYSNAINSYGQYDRLCVSLDTRIAVEGHQKYKTLRELIADYKVSGEKFMVFAYDTKNKFITTALAHHPRSSGFKDTVIVEFDDGTKLTCTADHPCMLRDGTYRHAGVLTPGTNMMSFARPPEYNHKVVSVTPGAKIEVGDITVDGFKNFATDTIFVHNSRYADFCLEGSTLIATNSIEGSIRIDELVERFNAGEKIDVFSYEHETGNIVCTTPSKAWKTGELPIYEVTFDDGSVLKATGNHPLLLRSGEYVRIDQIQDGTAIMPFDRKEFGSKTKTNKNTYRWIRSPKSGTFRPEHVLVAEADTKQKLGKDSGYHVHHIDFNSQNNVRNNLRVMLANDHLSLHAKINNARFNDPAERLKQSEIMKKRWKSGDLRKNQEENTEKRKLSGTHLFGKSLEQLIEYNKTFKPGRFNKGRTDQRGFSGPSADKTFTFQKIANVYKKGMSLRDVAKCLNESEYKVRARIRWEGYSSFEDFTKRYSNHKVVSIIKTDIITAVYDMEIPEHHNFAIVLKNNSGIIVSNSEMLYTPEISAAIDLYSDETCSVDEAGKVLQIYSENRKIRNLLEELFYDTLNVDFNLRMWVQNLVKYGDFFLFNDIAPGYGVMQVFPIPVNEVEREEGYDPEDPMAVRFRWVTQGNVALENWQLTHFRMLGNDAFLPYGSSVIEPARRIWRQLILIEDAMLVYRVVRSPERRIFYIDVGGIPPEEVPAYMAAQEAKLRSNTLVDRSTGRIDFRHNPLETLEDYFIPIRGTESGTKIDTLAGGQHVSATEDVEYIQKKLFAALKIPKAYLGYDESLSSKATLAQEDVRFSRTIQQIQKVVIAELQRLAYIHLFMNGYEGDDMFDFELKLNNPSSIAQQQKLELFARKFEIIGNAIQVDEGKVFSTPFLLRSIMNMSEQQQQFMHKEVVEDVQRRAALNKINEGASPESVGFGSGGGFTPTGAGSDDPVIADDELEGTEEFGTGEGDDAGPEGDTGSAEDAPDDEGGMGDLFAHHELEGEIVSEEDDASSTNKKPSLLDMSAVEKSHSSNAIKVSNRARADARNRKRSQTRHGPGETHMPDFARMTGMDDAQDDNVRSQLDDDPNPLRDILSTKLEHLESLGNDPRFAKEKVRLHEKIDALDFLKNYMSKAEPDPEPLRPRLTGAIQSVFEALELEFGAELAELRNQNMNFSDDIDNIITEVLSRDASRDDT